MVDKELLTDLFNLLDPLTVVFNEFPLDEYSLEVKQLYHYIKENPEITPEQIGNRIYFPGSDATLEKCILLGSIYLNLTNEIIKYKRHSLIKDILNMWDPFFKLDGIPKNTDYSPYVKEIILHNKISTINLEYTKMLLFKENPKIDNRDNSVKIFINLVNKVLNL